MVANPSSYGEKAASEGTTTPREGTSIWGIEVLLLVEALID